MDPTAYAGELRSEGNHANSVNTGESHMLGRSFCTAHFAVKGIFNHLALRAKSRLLLGAICAASWASAGAASGASSAIAVTVKTDETLARIGDGAVGLDIWFPNNHATDSEAVRLYREAGVQAFGYDGGPAVDMFDWRTSSLRPWPNPERAQENFATSQGRFGLFEDILRPQITFDAFAKLNRELGTVGRVHVNYGTGSPEEAAAWVAYSRKVGYDIRYWEIGQFMSGNGAIEGGNQPDAHEDKSAKSYASNSLKFIAAMRAADPSIKIGIHLHWDTKEGSAGRAWNEEVLSALAPQIDFIDMWAYPRGSDAEALQSTSLLPEWISTYRTMLERFGTRGRKYEIVIGETALDILGNPRNMSLVAALFLPDQYLTLFKSGVRRVDWFADHLGPVPRFWYSWAFNNRELRGTAAMIQPTEYQYGEYGIISSGDCDAETNICQPIANTPFAPYYGLKVLQVLTQPGASLLETKSPDKFVAVHAAKRPDGSIATLLINKDPTAIKTVALDLSGFKVAADVAVLFYGKGSSDVSCRQGAASLMTQDIALPPYSITVLVSDTSHRVSCQELLAK